MARIIQDREDLLKEAVALVQRVELALRDETGADIKSTPPHQPVKDDGPPNVVVGFRESGEASFYFTPDDAYHFNTQGQLRRAFTQGVKYKADQQKLFALVRMEESTQMKFHAEEIAPQQQQQFCQRYLEFAVRLQLALKNQYFKIVGQVPAEANVIGRIETWLAAHGSELVLAPSVNASS